MPSPLIQSGFPLCSLERVRELGLDPAKVPSCRPKSSENGRVSVLGCPLWDTCRFDKPGYGNFKGVKPQKVGYYYRTIEGRAKTDQIACHGFVATLQPAMDQGIADRLAGRPNFETVKIIAQEGQAIPFKLTTIETKKDGTTKFKHETVKKVIEPMQDPSDIDTFIEFDRDIQREFEQQVSGDISAPVKGS